MDTDHMPDIMVVAAMDTYGDLTHVLSSSNESYHFSSSKFPHNFCKLLGFLRIDLKKL